MTAFRKPERASLSIRLALALIIARAFLLWGSAAAHDYSPPKKWDTSITPATTSADTNYAWAIIGAANDYTFNTNLTVNYCTSPCGNIRHYENDYGNTDWAARALFRGSLISYATVQWNAYHGPFDSNASNFIARHELGHVFGLAHVPCSGSSYEWSVMLDGCSGGLPSVLTDHDKRDVNAKY